MISGRTTLVGIFGKPIGHSMSPQIHNAAFKALGLDYLYLPFEVDPAALGSATDAIRALNLRGVNVTIPHKEEIIPFLDELSEEAHLIGAVNTVVNSDGHLLGLNTDGRGFVTSLRQEAKVEPEQKKIAILGSGGAARAVAVQLALEGAAEIFLLSKNKTKGEAIAQTVRQIGVHAETIKWEAENIRKLLPQVEILINSTPVGMYPKHQVEPVINKELLHKDLLVCDLVYNPLETSLLKAAQEVGCPILKGTGMLVYQGAIAFKAWTGVEAPVKVMYQTLLANLS